MQPRDFPYASVIMAEFNPDKSQIAVQKSACDRCYHRSECSYLAYILEHGACVVKCASFVPFQEPKED